MHVTLVRFLYKVLAGMIPAIAFIVWSSLIIPLGQFARIFSIRTAVMVSASEIPSLFIKTVTDRKVQNCSERRRELIDLLNIRKSCLVMS